MDKADDAVAKWLTLKSDNPHHEQPIACADCGGCPVDDGAAFVSLLWIANGVRHFGWVCELCYLRRLHKRARFNNMASEPGSFWQIDLPEIGVRKEPKRPPPKRPDPRKYAIK